MRQLMILRHAKSAWPDVADHERPLAERGRRDAPRAGRWLLETGRIPGHVTCSTAQRARQTWQLVEGELQVSPPVRFDDRLYAAELDDVLSVIGETPDQVSTLLIVGHEPSARDVTLYLAGTGRKHLLETVRDKFPTGAIATLELPGRWTELGENCARLTGFFAPKLHRDERR
jgi:phosphohistidine phosphatase